jgi:hypothetical protein
MATVLLVSIAALTAGKQFIPRFGSLTMERMASDDELKELRAQDQKATYESAARALVDKHPRDPRLRMLHGIAIYGSNKDWAAAEAELRKGLELSQDNPLFRAELHQSIRALLVYVLMEERKFADARQVAAPLCDLVPDPQAGKEWEKALDTVQRSACRFDPLVTIASLDASASYELAPRQSPAGLEWVAELNAIRQTKSPTVRDESAWRSARRFPDDPRALFSHAVAMASIEKDYAGAEVELRKALKACDATAGRFHADFPQHVRAMLAADLLQQGKKEEAASIAAPLCASKAASDGVEAIRAQFCK